MKAKIRYYENKETREIYATVNLDKIKIYLRDICWDVSDGWIQFDMWSKNLIDNYWGQFIAIDNDKFIKWHIQTFDNAVVGVQGNSYVSCKTYRKIIRQLFDSDNFENIIKKQISKKLKILNIKRSKIIKELTKIDEKISNLKTYI